MPNQYLASCSARLATSAAAILLLGLSGCGSVQPSDDFLDSQLFIVNDSGVRRWEATGITIRKFCGAFIDGCSWKDDRDKTTKAGGQNFLMTAQVSRSKKPFSVRILGQDGSKQAGISELIFEGAVMPWGMLYSNMWDLTESAKQVK